MNTGQYTPEEIESMLASLGRALPAVQPGFFETLRSRIDAEAPLRLNPRTVQIRRWIMRSTIGLAAASAITLLLWTVFLATPQRTYGIEDLRERILSLNSLHLKGSLFAPAGPSPLPIEIFVQRPDRIRINRTVPGPNGLMSIDSISTPSQRTTIVPAMKQFVVEPLTAADARMVVVGLLHGQVLPQLIGEKGADFKKVRNETVGGIQTDVYERTVGTGDGIMRVQTWINSASGFPVRSEIHQTVPGGAEQLICQFNLIEPNVAIPAETFRFDPPADFAVQRSPFHPTTGGQMDKIAASLRFAFQVNPRAVLVCWCLYDADKPADDLVLPDKQVTVTVTSEKGISFDARQLRADPSAEGYHWRWTMFTAKDAKSALEPSETLSLDVHNGGSSVTEVFLPLSGDHNELESLLSSAQTATMTADTRPLTLDQLEKEIRP